MKFRSKEGKKALESNNWISIPEPKPNSKIRLLCFPYAGGMREIYLPWIGKLSKEVELVIMQYPGHVPGSAEKRFEDMDLMVSAMLGELTDFFDKPYALYGHSMGCRVILALIKHIKHQELPEPSYLFLGANKPPHMTVVRPPFQHMTIDESVNMIEHFDVLPQEVLDNRDLLEIILPILISDFNMLDSFGVDEQILPLHIPVCCFAGVDDELAYPEEMREWEQYTDAGFQLMEIPDKHYFINNNNLRMTIISKVEDCLKKQKLIAY